MGELTIYRRVSIFDGKVVCCCKKNATDSEWRNTRDSAKKTLRELYVGSVFKKAKR